jgi:RNA recognition motif-containing protein
MAKNSIMDFDSNLSLFSHSPTPILSDNTIFPHETHDNFDSTFLSHHSQHDLNNMADDLATLSSQFVRNSSFGSLSPQNVGSMKMSTTIGQQSADPLLMNPPPNFDYLTAPIPKRVVDSAVIDSLLKSNPSSSVYNHTMEPSTHFINQLFQDDELNSSHMFADKVDNYSGKFSRPSSRILDLLGSSEGMSGLHSSLRSDSSSQSNLRERDDNHLADSLVHGFDSRLNLQANDAKAAAFYPGGSIAADPFQPQSGQLNMSMYSNPGMIIRPQSTPILSSSTPLFDGLGHGYHIDDSLARAGPQQHQQQQVYGEHHPHPPGGYLVHHAAMSSIPNPSPLMMVDSNQHQQQHHSQASYPRPGNRHVGYQSNGFQTSRQVSTPIIRSNINIQSINGYRHTAGPIINKPSGDLDPASVEALITSNCRIILKDASNKALKAVELANTLRARVGTEVLAYVRETWGGLLSLLERHPKFFRVDRIPKNDMVTLCDEQSPAQAHSLNLDDPHASIAPGVVNSLLRPSISQSNLSESSHGQDTFSPTSPESQGGAGYVSKCLHVGNVPNNLTEKDLIKEFDKYGSIEAVKLINQRGRRFAFVCYKTIEMAANAKNVLSRLHPWKSAISFAHRDFVGNTETSPSGHQIALPQRSMSTSPYPGGGGNGSPMKASSAHQQHLQRISSPPLPNDPSGMMPAAPTFRRVQSYAVGEQLHHPSNPMMMQPMPMHLNLPGHPMMSGPYHPHHLGGERDPSSSLDNSAHNNYDNDGSGSSYYHPSAVSNEQFYRNTGGGGGASSIFNLTILRRLCDDTYVPTQAWPIDLMNDPPFNDAIIAQLMQFGGSTSISKLRGFLRARINAPDNIKSVPLKALLAAYPQYFHVRNNQVSLIDHYGGGAASTGVGAVMGMIPSHGSDDQLYNMSMSSDSLSMPSTTGENSGASTYRAHPAYPWEQASHGPGIIDSHWTNSH